MVPIVYVYKFFYRAKILHKIHSLFLIYLLIGIHIHSLLYAFNIRYWVHNHSILLLYFVHSFLLSILPSLFSFIMPWKRADTRNTCDIGRDHDTSVINDPVLQLLHLLTFRYETISSGIGLRPTMMII